MYQSLNPPKVYSQRPLTMGAGYRPDALAPFNLTRGRTLVGVGQAEAAGQTDVNGATPASSQLPEASMHTRDPFRAAPLPLTADTCGVYAGMTDEERAAAALSRSIKYSHPDTAAYEWGGGVPTPFDDWRDWQGLFRAVLRPEWIYNTPRPKTISQQVVERGHKPIPITSAPERFAVSRNVPYFAAEKTLVPAPPLIPTWPDRRAPYVAGGHGPAPIFRVVGETKPQSKAPMWPYIPASQSGDVPVVIGRYLRALQWEMPSGTYITARDHYMPREYQANPHQLTAQTVYYDRGTRPGLLEPSLPRDESWAPAEATAGLGHVGRGRARRRPGRRRRAIGNCTDRSLRGVGDAAVTDSRSSPWFAIAMIATAIPGALLAWQQLKTAKTAKDK